MAEENISAMAYGMSEMAATYPNHIIANALAKVSSKLESLGKPFSDPLDDADKSVIKFYRAAKK